jgi:hypothetical protein
MKFALQIAAAFMAPLMMFCWVYALGRMAMNLWELPPTIAFFAAVVVTIMQILFVFAADAAGLINERPGEKG